MTDDLLARIEVLEAKVEALAPPTLVRQPDRYEPAPWLREMISARAVECRHKLSPWSEPDGLEVRMVGEINAAMRQSVLDALHGAPFVMSLRFVIDSVGGEFESAVAIYRSIRFHPATSKIAILGKNCSSAAVLVMAAADRRIAAPDTSVLLHLVSATPNHRDRWTVRRYLTAAKELQVLDAELLNLLADRTGAPLETLLEEAETELPMSVDRALELGIVTEVAAP